jgi:hypothetical protein
MANEAAVCAQPSSESSLPRALLKQKSRIAPHTRVEHLGMSIVTSTAPYQVMKLVSRNVASLLNTHTPANVWITNFTGTLKPGVMCGKYTKNLKIPQRRAALH